MKRPTHSTTEVHDLALDRLTLSAEVQPRGGEDVQLMREYTGDMLDGAEFPPVDVFWDREADEYHLADGFHRVKAALAARKSSIRAHLHLGTKRDAILFSVGANAAHGQRRSHEDKRIAVMKLLEDPEWSLWNDAEIARACHVSASMVSNLRDLATNSRGHQVGAKVGGDGMIRMPKWETTPNGRHQMKSAPLTKREVHELYASKIARHLRKSDPATRTAVPYPLGTVEIQTSRRLYHTLVGRDTDYLYRHVGRMIVLRQVIDPKLGITLVGHFAPGTERLTAVLRGLDIECATPEQVLRRKDESVALTAT